MPSANITARLMASLPESIWAEANRRIRLVPELWKLAEDDQILDALCKLGGEEARWRPGNIALAAYSAKNPACQATGAEAWFFGDGRERIGVAYAQLTNASLTTPLQPLDQALPAALALRLRMRATFDWSALAVEAGAQPERWRLPLQFLWGFLTSPNAIFSALMKGSPASARIAGLCLVTNHALPDAIEIVSRLSESTPVPAWPALAQAIEGVGEVDYARAIIKAVAAAHPALQTLEKRSAAGESELAEEVDAAMLLAASADHTLANPLLTRAWTHTKQLGATLSGHIARLALTGHDPVAALAGYQAALSEQPDDPELLTGLAQSLAALNRPAEAAGIAQTANTSVARLVSARAKIALNRPLEAQEILQQLTAPADDKAPHTPLSADNLAEAAQIYHDLNNLPEAIGLMRQAAAQARTNASQHLIVAHWLGQAGRWAEARDAALEAAALAPHEAAIRETLGQALLHTGEAVQAVPHFQSAVAFDPTRWSARLGLAKAALATRQPVLTRDAAKHALTQPLEPTVEGEAHVLLGQALSLLNEADQAFQHFHRASVLTPAASEPWRAMAQHHLQRGETDQAVATLEAGRQALTLGNSPQLAPLLADLAEVYQTTRRHTEAIVAWREVCSTETGDAEAHRKLGTLLRQQGYIAEAITTLRHALQLAPGDGQCAHELGQALEKNGQVDEAWAAYQQAVLARPAEAQPYLNLGRVTLAQCRRQAKNASPFQAVAALTEAAGRARHDADQSAEAYGLLAQAQQLAGNLDSALASYQQALQLAPKRTEWSLGLGEICIGLGKPQMAIAALQDALAHAPEAQAATIHQALAQAYAQSNLWPEARHSAEMTLSLTGETPALLGLLAEASTHLNQPERAAEYWRQAVGLNPRDAQIQIRLARSLLDAGKADEARGVYAQALALAPDSAEIHLAAGAAFIELAEYDLAFEVLSEAANLAPRSAQAQAAFGQAASRSNKFDTAQTAFLRAAELTNGEERATYLRLAGEALWAMGRTAAAIALWQRASAINPQDARLLSRLGLGLGKLGQPAEALAALEKALELGTRESDFYPETLREAARAALALGRPEQASAYLDHAIHLRPDDAECRFLLGKTREQQGQPDQALVHYRQATRLHPGEGQYLAASAETLAKQGKLAEAIQAIEEALRASSDNPEVQQRAGDIYLQAGKTHEAAQAYQLLVASRPRNPQAHLALARALVTLVETHAFETQAGLKPTLPSSKHSLPDAQPLPDPLPVLQQAAALGAEPLEVRYWMGRAKAVLGNPQEARQLLETVAGSKATSRIQMNDLYRVLGMSLRKAGQPQRALETLMSAARQNGMAAGAADDEATAALHLEIGLTHAALNDTRGALNAYKRAVAAAPSWPIPYFHLAETLQALDERSEAIQVLQRAISLKPDAAAWHYRLAKIYQAEHDSPTALAHFQRAQELDPGNASYAADLAHTLAYDGDLTAAVDLFRRATEIAPENDGLWTERGQTHLALKDHKAAAHSFGRAAQLAPTNVAALLGLARVHLAENNLHEAANKAEAAARLAPEDTELHVEALICLAEIQIARGDNAAAESSFAAAAAKTTQPAPALLALGRLYTADGKLPEAIDALERAAAALPPNDDGQRQADLIFATLGKTYQAAGRPEEALTAYREAVRISPRNYHYLLQLGQICREQGQLDQALAHLLQAHEIKPNSDLVLRETGLVYEQRKEYDRALEMHQQAIKLAPNSSDNFTRAGVVLKQLKAYPEAAQALERAVALDTRNVEATKQLAVVSALNLMYGRPKVRN
jgi:tetratricopeptide (TPR) repeat protein